MRYWFAILCKSNLLNCDAQKYDMHLLLQRITKSCENDNCFKTFKLIGLQRDQ